MAGWLVTWNLGEASSARKPWRRAVALAQRYGEQACEIVEDKFAVAAWRRERGEFPHSGMIFHPAEEMCLAWVGQTLGDQGDTSLDTIGLLSNRSEAFTDIAALNGAFAAAAIRKRPLEITLWNDRHRHYPVYVHEVGRLGVASTDWRCLVPWIQHPNVNRSTVRFALTCGELIEGMTHIGGIEILDGGCTTTFGEGHRRQRRQYWRMRHRPDQSLDFDACAREAVNRLRKSVRRIETACPRLGVPLSGGLDSRMLLALCSRPQRVPSFTWGQPQCRDICFATDLARRVGSSHHVRTWEPHRFVELWGEGVDRTAGSMPVHEMFVLPFVKLVAEHCDVVLNGLAGDALLGGNVIQRRWLKARDVERLAELSWEWRVAESDEHWAARISKKPDECENPKRLWVTSVVSRFQGTPVRTLNDWFYENRVFRYVNCGTMLLRKAVESHAPFFDRDVVDFLLRVPLEHKWKHNLYLCALKYASPTAACVRWQRTALRPSSGFALNLASLAFHRIWRRLNGIIGRTAFPSQMVADPAQWMRGEWREPVKRIILADRCLERGIVDPDATRRMWTAHQGGENRIRQIGILIVVELLCRMVLDGEEIPTLGRN